MYSFNFFHVAIKNILCTENSAENLYMDNTASNVLYSLNTWTGHTVLGDSQNIEKTHFLPEVVIVFKGKESGAFVSQQE